MFADNLVFIEQVGVVQQLEQSKECKQLQVFPEVVSFVITNLVSESIMAIFSFLPEF
jgi:hypothetical protein